MDWRTGRAPRARRPRKSSTSFEATLWRILRGRRFQSLKFRRQHPVGRYFLDFACCELHLAIELDGTGHLDRLAYDLQRDAFLAERGWTVLRVENRFVACELHAFLETLVHEVERVRARLPSPRPSPHGERD